ncbi:unnamed protein product [Notodromas monacha]|nr:unnamed protein product [Notodromas monacha]CAG0919137.1 unnamed protein product [Notodromas monacha]
MWWDEQNEETRDNYRRMVDEGRLEFIGGGWSMNDEASAHYTAIIDNMSWGWKFLEDTFGTCGRPKIGWQIDPFGHSREQAAIFAEMGMDGLFFARLDYRDKTKRKNEQTMEMLWRANPRLGAKSEIFTGALYNHYSPPPGFCFDLLCSDVIIDNPNSPDYNVISKVSDLIKWAEDEAKAFKTNHVMITMGNDFNYQDAHVWYKNLDKLIRYVNAEQASGSRVNLFYSTPSCYLKGLNDAGVTWPTKTDDFFPYASDPHAYWTGYFISRPTFKGYIRSSNAMLQAVKQMSSLAPAAGSLEAELNLMREALGINQHHDAVTGTAKQHVTDDYYRILHNANVAGWKIFEAAANSASAVNGAPKLAYSPCPRLNISECAFTESTTSGNFIITVYNPLGRPQSPLIVFPVVALENGSPPTYVITDPEGNTVPHDVFPLPQPILVLPGRNSNAEYQVHFVARDLPPVGFASYHVSVSTARKNRVKREVKLKVNRSKKQGFVFENDFYVITLDSATGHVSSIERKDQPGISASVRQEFMFYNGMRGFNQNFSDRASGAYIFRPESQAPLTMRDQLDVSFVAGDVLTEIRAYTEDWASHVIRFRSDSEVLESEWIAGPIPIDDGVGKELISRFVTDIRNGAKFYTDSNGKLTEPRTRDYRPTFELGDDTEAVSRNYYPVLSRSYIRDEDQSDPNLSRQLTILTDRAQGGGSIVDGALELMVHRRLLYDDAFGVGEALNESAFGTGLVARGLHKFILTSVSNAAKLYRAEEVKDIMRPLYAFAPTSLSAKKWLTGYATKVSALKAPLPENVNLMTLEPWRDGRLLMRLEHMFEPGEDAVLSNSAPIELLDILAAPVLSIRETDLSGSQVAPVKMKWDYEGKADKEDESLNDDIEKGVITLRPSEIRTFVVTLA